MQRKKGGVIQWAHSWQKFLVGAIYRLQRCETTHEFEECKLWVRDFINACRELDGGTLRNLVQTFFQLKIDIAERWIKVFRMGIAHLNIVSSSRIEGEFSCLWLLRLTSALTLCKSFVKLRFERCDSHSCNCICLAQNTGIICDRLVGTKHRHAINRGYSALRTTESRFRGL